MKVTMSEITKIRIEGAPALDPIDVFLEDHGPKQGSITIKCYGESWTTYWGGMWEGLTVAQFFCNAPEDYVLDRLYPGTDFTVSDWSGLEGKMKALVIDQRKKFALGKDEARRLFNEIEFMSFPAEGEHPSKDVTDMIVSLFDYCWWDHIPQKTNPKYTYLRRIVQAVREALTSIDQKVPA